MSLNFEHQTSHRRHRRTVSVRTLSAILPSSSCTTPSSRPSTASTQSSFSTAYTSLGASQCFRYYLPHISTEDEGVYTRNDSYSCNLSPITPFCALPPVQYGRFYQYIPGLSSEVDDVYTDGAHIMCDTLRGPGMLHVQPEQKVMSRSKEVNCDDSPVEVTSPLPCIGPMDFACRPGICVTEAVNIEVDTYAAGERLGSTANVSIGPAQVEEKKGINSSMEKHKRSVSLAGMSKKVREMLQKMHIGKKEEK